MKNKIISFAIIFAFFFSLGFVYEFHYPRLKEWIRTQVYLQSYDNLPALIEFRDLELSPFTLGVVIYDLEMKPKKGLETKTSGMKIKEIRIHASFLKLLLGRFEISSIEIIEPVTSVIIRKTANSNPSRAKSFDYADLLQRLKDIPLDSIHIKKGLAYIRLDEFDQSLQVKDFDVSLDKQITGFHFFLDIPNLKVKQRGVRESLTFFSLVSDVQLTKDRIYLERLVVKRDDSFIAAKASMPPAINKESLYDTNLVASWNLQLESVRDWVHTYHRRLNLPKIHGRTSGQVNLDRSNELLSSLKIKGQNLGINQYNIGNVDVSGQLAENFLLLQRLELKNKSQNIEITKSKMFLDKAKSFSANLNLKAFELSQLLTDLGLNEVPLKLQASGTATCSGAIQPRFFVNCLPKIEVPHFHLNNKKQKLVEVNNIKANGSINITAKDIHIAGEVELPKSKGSANSRIQYDEGFIVNFQSEQLDFSDLDYIVGLNFKGISKLSGSTYGNSRTAKLDISINNQDFYFQNVFMGNNTANITYSNPNLSIKQLAGNIENTVYESEVVIDVIENTIDIKGKSPIFNLNHINSIVLHDLETQIPVRGIASLDWHIFGPLRLSELNYNGSIQAQRIFLYEESIDRLFAEFESDVEKVNIVNSSLKKASSNAQIAGFIKKTGDLNVNLLASNLRSEESENLRQYIKNFKASMNVAASLEGKILEPSANIEVNLPNYAIGNREFQKGKIDLLYSDEKIQIQSALFNDAFLLNTSKYLKDRNSIDLNAEFKSWDFTSIFGLISEGGDRDAYESNLNGKLSMSLNTREPLQSELEIELDAAKLAISDYFLELQEPMLLEYKRGNVTTINTILRGNDNYYLEVESNSRRKMALRGEVNIALVSFLLPFARDISGTLNLNSNLFIKDGAFELLGEAKLRNGYARIEDFPMAFEQTVLDASFSQESIQINQFQANFGGGSLRGDGFIQLKGLNNIPLKIEAILDKANLQLNKSSSLLSSGNLILEGNWFPYSLRGNVEIRKGVISPDNSSNEKTIRKSKLLPEIVKEDSFVPINADLNVNILGNQVRIEHPFIRVPIQGQLSVQGDITKPYLSGEISQAQKGTLLFNEAEFEIDSLTATFPLNNNMNPNIYLNANTRWKEYDINLIATGTLNDPRANFTSQPPLNENDIITLLTLGYTQDTLVEEETEEASDSKAYEIGTAIINRNPINQQLEDKTGITFKFNTTTDSANENITVPKVEVSKKWGNKLETKAGRTFGKVLRNDAQVEYKINDKFSVVGSWEGESINENAETSEFQNEDVFGLDLEYKVEFK